MSLREIKLCLLGDAGVGKSSLVLRFVSDTFNTNSESTIGASFMSKVLEVNDQAYKYQIWDTAGQEKYRGLAPMYYRGAAAAIVVYDITSKESFQKLQDWMRELQHLGPPEIVLAIAGNKCDLSEKREVAFEDAKNYAEQMNAIFAETSALQATNVHALFEAISKKLPQEVVMPNTLPQTITLSSAPPEKEKKTCC
ncbi:ras-related protein Rab-22A-like [Sycon ciliatum]|uniref:ras-related protein Rab-22A-like n=1 Tax=Sycon ciliatum TaxID=27933 RepID=UPI0020AECB4D|eukprot:scpid73815/ scgid19802/ Ras-related protein Rab-22A; Rab-14